VTVSATPAPQLQPLALSELLDRAVRLYRNNFVTLLGIIALVEIPLQFLSLVISLLTFGDTFSNITPGQQPTPEQVFTPGYFIGIASALVIGLLSLILVNGLATAAITRAIADSYLGKSVGIFEAYERIGGLGFRLVGSILLASLFGVVLFIWTIIPCVGWLSGPGMLVFYGSVVTPLIAPAIVLEGQTASGAIRRAWDLTRRRFWWTIGFVLILFIFNQLVVTGPTSLASFLLNLVFGSATQASDPFMVFTVQTIVQSIVGLVFSLIYVPFQLVNITLMYFDLRVRTEGLDIAMLAGGLSDNSLDPTHVVAEAPRPESSRLVTMSEVGYFVLLTVIALVGYFALALVFAALGLAIMGAGGGFPPR